MDKFMGIAKGGWHPEKDAGKTGGIKDSVRGLIGKGEKRQETHYSTPYVRKDPASFPPPPPTRRYGEGETVTALLPRTHQPTLPPRNQTTVIDEQAAEPVPPKPFVADTTGIDISKYPKPPPRNSGVASPTKPADIAASKPKPSLPPRLPPRNDPVVPLANSDPTNPSIGLLNQNALNRLGSAGISVPGFNIGSTKPAPPIPSRADGTVTSPVQQSPSGGTSWAEKQAALKTANNLRANPGAVSLSEIRSAATTAKNFQDRHGDQVAAGVSQAQQANQKYGIAERMNNLSMASGKAPPPPPPAKKFQGLPPSIPLSSKPKPS